jgi:hypothetical protein
LARTGNASCTIGKAFGTATVSDVENALAGIVRDVMGWPPADPLTVAVPDPDTGIGGNVPICTANDPLNGTLAALAGAARPIARAKAAANPNKSRISCSPLSRARRLAPRKPSRV